MTKTALKHKQILFITTDFETKTSIQLQNENLLIVKDTKTKSIPHSRVLALIICGNISLTSPLIEACLKHEISLVLATSFGKHICTISPEHHSLELKKYQFCSNTIELAQMLITDKIQAQTKLLQKRKIYHPDSHQITQIQTKILQAANTSSILGIEGNVAQSYYQTLFQSHNWQGRTPRTKKDITNTLMDMGYMRLYYVFEALVSLYGFDPYIGFLHTHYYNRKSLVCDLMEPFRPTIDDILLTLLNRNQIRPQDFVFDGAKWGFANSKAYYKYSSLFLRPLSQNIVEMYVYIGKYADYINKNLNAV
jgi:CRISP-associated protein Cas1